MKPFSAWETYISLCDIHEMDGFPWLLGSHAAHLLAKIIQDSLTIQVFVIFHVQIGTKLNTLPGTNLMLLGFVGSDHCDVSWRTVLTQQRCTGSHHRSGLSHVLQGKPEGSVDRRSSVTKTTQITVCNPPTPADARGSAPGNNTFDPFF